MATKEVRLSLIKLRLAMIGTWALVTAVASLIFVAVLSYVGAPFLSIYSILGFVVFFHVFQWLIGPYIVGAIYRVRPAEGELAWLQESVHRIAQASGLSRQPKTMVAEISIPNAFAYGSPLTGPIVAVTRPLVNNFPREEVEAIIGHEIGHIRHRDVAVMLMISIIPAIIYYLGYSLLLSGMYGGRDRGGGGGAALIGGALIAASFIFNLFVFYMSRLREYYADYHAATVVRDGARNLQRGLVRIMTLTGRLGKSQVAHYDQFKAFFIADPDQSLKAYGDIDRLVEEVKNSRPSLAMELFSTHPHPAKRLKHLDKFISINVG
ncbi:MAG: zinc metalloprotease HtpX [Nitrososphaerota archaeon]